MAVGLQVLGNPGKALRQMERDLLKSQRKLETARTRSLNRAMRTVRKEAGIIVRQNFNVKAAKPVKEAMRVKNAKRGEAEATLTASAVGKRGRIPLILFGPKPVDRRRRRKKKPPSPGPKRSAARKSAKRRVVNRRAGGVKVKIFTGSPEKTIRSAFFGYKKKGVYMRKKGAARFPIRTLYGPPVVSGVEYNMDEISTVGINALEKNLQSQLRLAFG